MGLLKYISYYNLKIVVAFFCLVLIGCEENESSNRLKTVIVKDSIPSSIEIDDLYNLNWEKGFQHFVTNKNNIYIAAIKDKNSIILYNIKNKVDSLQINAGAKIESFVIKNDYIFCILNDNKVLRTYKFKNGELSNYTFRDKTLANTFNDSVFNSTSINSGIVILDTSTILVPYRVSNNSENLVDVNAYIQINNVENANLSISEIKYPDYFKTKFEYLRLPIASYLETNNTVYYTFQKKSILYSYNLNSKKIDSVIIPNFHTSEFEVKNKTDITQIRKYVDENDQNCNLLTTKAGDIFLLKKNRKASKNKFDLFVFSLDLQLRGTQSINTNLETAMAFTKENKLYVKTEYNNYYIFATSE